MRFSPISLSFLSEENHFMPALSCLVERAPSTRTGSTKWSENYAPKTQAAEHPFLPNRSADETILDQPEAVDPAAGTIGDARV